MFLRGWSLDHLCWNSSEGPVSRQIPWHHPCVELELLGGGQNVAPASSGDTGAGAARVILPNELTYPSIYF